MKPGFGEAENQWNANVAGAAHDRDIDLVRRVSDRGPGSAARRDGAFGGGVI
jgi:hypothetical protein